jgi:Mor family transcriptional regulator
MEIFLAVDELSEKSKVSKVWLYKLVREKIRNERRQLSFW